jgi:iron complex outermembrane recepter protein
MKQTRLSMNRLARMLITTAIGSALAAGQYPAFADASATPADDSSDSNQLGEVVVTANKRPEELLKVPAPVTALQAADLTRWGSADLSDYAGSVPGLNVTGTEAGQTVVIMRGITTGFGYAIPATTSTYIDDVPYGSSTAAAYGSVATLDLDPGSLQRVEILRGPQGTLYGASSLGGLIKYVTSPPSLTHYSARAELAGTAIDGGGEGYTVRAMFDGPLIADKLGMTLSAFDRHDPGYISDPFRNRNNENASRTEGGRVALLWQPTDQLSVKLAAIVQNTLTNGTSAVDLNSDLTPIYGKYEQVRYGNAIWDFRNRLYSLTVNYDLGWATLTSITGYAQRTAMLDIDFTNKFGGLLSGILNVPNLAVYDDITLDNNKTTQEVRLASPSGGAFEWLGGVFYTHEHSVKPEAFANPYNYLTGVVTPVPDGIFTDTLYDSYSEIAGYADLTYHVTSDFKILGGVRYSNDKETSITPFSGILFGPPTTDIGTSSDNSVTYLVSPSYDLNGDNMVYLRVASGFRPGGPTGVSASNLIQGAPETYAPDKLTNYELGYKARLPQEQMTLDLSAFDIEWKHIQLLQNVNGFVVTANGSNARSTGLEAAWMWRPITGVDLSATADYTHAYLTSDAPGIGGKAGDDLPDTPQFSANVAADYDFPITAQLDGFAGVEYQYEGERHIDFIAGTPPGFITPMMPGYSMVNLRAGLDRGNFSVEAYVKNIGNAYGMLQLVSQVRNGYGPPLAASVIAPRTFGLSITAQFK